MKRTTTSAVPYSDTLATQVMVDGFVLSSSDHQGVSASFTRQFTAIGQTLTSTDGRGNTTSTLLDIAGRTLLTRDAAGNETSMTYCENSNNVATVTDSMGNVVRYGYDHRGRKVSEFGTGIAPACFAYDDVDQLIGLRTFRVTAGDVTSDPSLREDGDTTTWTYHAATGLLLSTTHADGSQELRTYNAFNQLASLTNARGQVAQHGYQLATGDLTQVSYDDESTPNQSFAYNHLGQITQVTDGAGTRQFTYDAYGEQEGDSVHVNSTDFKVAELRDEMGRSIGYNLMRGTGVMQGTSMSYDAQGRLAQAGFAHGGESKNFSYEYLAGTHLLQSLTHPNNIKWNYVYEAQRDLLTQINDTRGTTDVVLRTYTNDALGRPMTRRYARQGTVRNDNFTYNSRSELIGSQMGSDAFAYDYDNIGNRKTSQETLQGVAENLTYDTNVLNQYARVGAAATVAQEDFTPSFDLDGNQTLVKTSTGIWSVSYNVQNRPVRFTQGETIIECQYDSQGRRVFKKVSVAGAITLHHRYLYRGYVQIATLDMTRSGLNGLWFILWDPSQPTATRPLAIQIAGTWMTYGLDLTKNVCELYRSNGTIATAYTYTPFGQATAVGTTTQPLGWSSECMDSELDLVYYNYRHYNPQDGRWINRDPIGIEGGYNLYGFVGNSMEWLYDILGKRKIKPGDSWNVVLNSKRCGKIKVTEYQIHPELSTNARKSIIAQIFTSALFSPEVNENGENSCCCKDGDFRWISTVTKDTELGRPKTPYLDLLKNQKGPYYDPTGGDGYQNGKYKFRDTPAVPGFQLVKKIFNNEKAQIDVEFKTQLVCASNKNQVLTDFEWGFSYSATGDGGMIRLDNGFVYLDINNKFNIKLK